METPVLPVSTVILSWIRRYTVCSKDQTVQTIEYTVGSVGHLELGEAVVGGYLLGRRVFN